MECRHAAQAAPGNNIVRRPALRAFWSIRPASAERRRLKDFTIISFEILLNRVATEYGYNGRRRIPLVDGHDTLESPKKTASPDHSSRLTSGRSKSQTPASHCLQ
ncbi:hypothetical protein BV898_19558 [Hypsibius exemplaris]|uniref:Uncharacterized protein n=1 Tax=Hypsibius exemplaris TaxID=2072580 RepID=A0A9X6NLV6_HYPEX|nr:hypothetical protein BV898_19558 [Hypsibius exemplaris]